MNPLLCIFRIISFILNRKLLLILAVISFALPIAYFNWVYYIAVYSTPSNEFFLRQNYFIEMYWILNHWASGEMGMGYYPLYWAIFGVVLLVIGKLLPVKQPTSLILLS